MRTLLLVTAFLTLSACAPAQHDALAVVAEPDCGVDLVVNSRMGRPDVPRIRSGESVAACGLPTAAEIAFACESADATDRPGGERSHPDYAVSNVSCAFANDRTGARCGFDLADAGASRRIEADFEHRFVDLSNDTEHDHLVTLWRPLAACR